MQPTFAIRVLIIRLSYGVCLFAALRVINCWPCMAADAGAFPQPPESARQLSWYEYENTIRHLFELADFSPVQDNFKGKPGTAIPEVLSPNEWDLVTERVLKRIFWRYGEVPPARQVRIFAKRGLLGQDVSHGSFHFLEDGTLALIRRSNDRASTISYFAPAPEAGTYRLRIVAYPRNIKDESALLSVQTGLKPYTSRRARSIVGHYEPTGTRESLSPIEVDVQLRQGEFVWLKYVNAALQREPRPGKEPPTDTLPQIVIEHVEVDGPINDIWPPPAIRTMLGGRDPRSVTVQHLAEILPEFAGRAFRRPVQANAIATVVQAAQAEIQRGQSPQVALRAGIKSILSSQSFLTINNRPGKPDDYTMAARLSYFLRDTLPDAELLELAEQGQLHNPQVIITQTKRLLHGAKSQAFVPFRQA